MQNEVKGIVSELIQDFMGSKVTGSAEIKAALQQVSERLATQKEVDLVLVDRLANYITYTVFINKIRLTRTQNLLLSQLMSIGRTSSIEGSFREHRFDASKFE